MLVYLWVLCMDSPRTQAIATGAFCAFSVNVALGGKRELHAQDYVGIAFVKLVYEWAVSSVG